MSDKEIKEIDSYIDSACKDMWMMVSELSERSYQDFVETLREIPVGSIFTISGETLLSGGTMLLHMVMSERDKDSCIIKPPLH